MKTIRVPAIRQIFGSGLDVLGPALRSAPSASQRFGNFLELQIEELYQESLNPAHAKVRIRNY